MPRWDGGAETETVVDWGQRRRGTMAFEALAGRKPQEKRLDLRLRFYAAADRLLVMPAIFVLFQTADNTIAAHVRVETFGRITVIGCILLSANCCNYLRKR